MSVARSLLYAAGHVLHPRMLWLMLWPMLVALGIWGSVALLMWGTLAVRLAAWLRQALDYALAWSHLDFGTAALVAANVLLFIAFVPLVYLTALFLLSLFGMQRMVDYVAQRSYPQLERRRGGGIAGSGWNSLVASRWWPMFPCSAFLRRCSSAWRSFTTCSARSRPNGAPHKRGLSAAWKQIIGSRERARLGLLIPQLQE